MDYRNPAECLAELSRLHPLDVDGTRTTLDRMIASLLDAMPAANQHLEVLEAAREQIALVQAEYARRYAAHPLPPPCRGSPVRRWRCHRPPLPRP